MRFCTYIYIDPERNVAMYVGQGSLDRPFKHLKKAVNKRFGNRLRALRMRGISPIIEIVEMPSYEMAVEKEIILIGLWQT